MKILEIGPGDGEMALWISKTVGTDGEYTAVDVDHASLKKLSKRIPTATLIAGSITDIKTFEQLKEKKFDVIYFRWVLAYTKKSTYEETLSRLYSCLDNNGLLICEECDLYKATCNTTNKESTLKIIAFNKWLELSRRVQDAVDANFSMGSEISKHLQTISNKEPVTDTFQPTLITRAQRRLPVISMCAARPFLVEQSKLKRSESFEDLTQGLEKIAEDPEIDMQYLSSTVAMVRR